ncbi:SGNH hydrolase-type esterase domain-containing protein [Aspergillus venezuelensis]
MKFTIPTMLAFVAATSATPLPRASSNPPYFITIGDLTVATNGGWGDGLLTLVASPADGENRGKSGSTTYESNLKGIVSDLQDLGTTPIIITPLSRRNFDGDTVSEDFVEWRLRAIAAAEDSEIGYLDLTTASTDYINAIGAENAETYDLSDGDGTHINEAGGIVFGRMVADLLLEKRDDLEEYITPNEELSEKIANGEYATGDE